MRRLKKFNEINYKLLINNLNTNTDNFINENYEINRYQHHLKKILKKIDIDLYYIEKYKLSILSLYPLINKLIHDKFPNKKINIQGILLIIVCCINILVYENKDKTQKLFNIAIKNNISEDILNYIIVILKDIKKIYSDISNILNKYINTFDDMLNQIELFIPFVRILYLMYEDDLINFNNLNYNDNDIKYKLLINRIIKRLEFIINSGDKIKNINNAKPLFINDELKSPELKNNKFILKESLKDKLKGKSKEEILNNVKNLTPEKKLEKGAKYGILSLVKQSIEEGADPSIYNNTPIRLASQKGHLNIVKYFLKDDRVDPSKYENITIRYASQNGHLDVVKELLKDKRVDPSDYDNYTIMLASVNGYLNIVKELLKDERVDPSDGNNASIKFASEYGHLNVVKELIKDKRVDPSDGNNDAIRYSSQNGHLNIVKELLKDERVINKLSKEELNYYKKQISDLNESLKDKLKGKSDDEMHKLFLDKINNLSKILIENRFTNSIEHANKFWYKYLEDVKKLLLGGFSINSIYDLFLNEINEYFK